MIDGRPRLRELFGRVRLTVEGDERWVALRHVWDEADGTLMKLTGRLNLGHRTLSEAETRAEAPR